MTSYQQQIMATCEHRPETFELFNELYPRRYITPFGYLDPKFAYAELACSAYAVMNAGAPKDEHSLHLGATMILLVGALIEHKSPTFFLAQDFGEVLVRSTLQEDLLVKDLKYAAKTAVVCLPEALMRKEFGVHIPYLMFTWQDQKSLQATLPGVSEAFTSGVLGFQFVHVRPDGTSAASWGQIPGGRNIRECLDAEYRVGYFGKQPDMTEQDKQAQTTFVVQKLHRFVLQIIMGMSALPQLIDSDSIARKAKAHKKKPVTELWNPRYIGFKYKRVPRPDYQPGTHASPIMHRRNGHWKQQPHGPERSLRKLIWVDEYWVCVPEEEPNNAKT